MNANPHGVMDRSVVNTIKYDSLTLAQSGLILNYGKKQVSQFSFSEVNKIYIKVHKLKTINGFVFVLLPMLFIFLFFEFMKLNIEISMALTPIIPSFVKINRFKRFSMVIILKNGTVFRKNVPLKLKSDTIELINEVKQKCLHYNSSALASA